MATTSQDNRAPSRAWTCRERCHSTKPTWTSPGSARGSRATSSRRTGRSSRRRPRSRPHRPRDAREISVRSTIRGWATSEVGEARRPRRPATTTTSCSPPYPTRSGDPSNGRDNSNSDNSNSDNSNSDDSNSGPKEARLRRNRASAALSRQRKRTELVHLRQRCRELERANRHIQYVAQCASHENAALRRRLAEIGGVAGGAPVPMSADVAVVPVTHLPIPRMRAQIKPCEAGLGRDLRRTRTAEGTSAGVTTSGVDDATYTLCDMPRVESRRRRGAAWRSKRGTERNHGTERSVCRPRRVRRVRRRFVKTRDEAASDLRDSSPGCAAPRRVTRAVESPATPSTGRDTRHPSSHRTLSAVLSGLTLAVPCV